MHGLAVYVKEGLPFARDLSLENSADSYLCFRLALLHSLSYFFFLYQSPSSSLCTVFDSISSNTDQVLSINPSPLEIVTSIRRTGLPVLVELIDLVNSVIIFLSQMILLGSQTVILIVLLFWIYSFLLMPVFVLQRLSLHWVILIMLLSQFPLTTFQIRNGMPCFIAQLMTILMWIGKVFVII